VRCHDKLIEQSISTWVAAPTLWNNVDLVRCRPKLSAGSMKSESFKATAEAAQTARQRPIGRRGCVPESSALPRLVPIVHTALCTMIEAD
jgi:hypothetical protein